MNETVFTQVSDTCQIKDLNSFYQKYFPGKRDGVFVEVGGNDGYLWSNTWGLAEIGWRGLYYEPDFEQADRCIQNHIHNNVRVIQAAVGAFNTQVRLYKGCGATTSFYVAACDLYQHGNNLDDYIPVRQVTLNRSLPEQDIPQDFDLLVIDVNGSEPDVLEGISLDQWKPRMLIIATHKGHARWDFNARKIGRMLSPWYREIFHDHINSIYIRREGR